MRVLISPDTLKGSCSASDAASEIARGWRSRFAQDELVLIPLADGGEGLMDALRTPGDHLCRTTVEDPLGRAVEASYLVMPDGTAVLESADPIGLTRLRTDELDPFTASSRGVGQLIAAAAARSDVKRMILGVGGVATVDGGSGLAEVLPSLPLPVVVATDVTNPLLGDRGAARVFGPQKGARTEDIALLEARLASMGFSPTVARMPGAGAAGGLGARLLAMGATLTSGIELVMERTGWVDALRQADLVITAEGTVDESSSEGKVVGGVCTASHTAGVAAIVLGGRVLPTGVESLESSAAAVLSLNGSIETAHHDLHRMGATLASLVHLSETKAGRND